MTETAWVGAAYNMLLFYVASSVSLFIPAFTFFIKSTRAKYLIRNTMLLFTFLTCKFRFLVLVGTFLPLNDKKRAGEACVIL